MLQCQSKRSEMAYEPAGTGNVSPELEKQEILFLGPLKGSSECFPTDSLILAQRDPFQTPDLQNCWRMCGILRPPYLWQFVSSVMGNYHSQTQKGSEQTFGQVEAREILRC